MVCIRCKKRPAIIFIQRMENGQMKQEGYCLHCARELHIKPVEDLMKQFGMSEQDMDNMEDRMESMMEEMGEGGNPFAALMNMQDGGDGSDGDEDGFTPGGNATFPLSITGQAGGQNGQQSAPNKNGRAGKKPPRRKYLDTYCENLTAKARDGRLDDIIGRDREIYRTIQILSRRQKNNPCLIGEAGVGKTAIAEGIAERIARGQVPAQLKDKEIYLLDLTALVAGTQFRGQFEQRVKGLLNEVKQAGNVILFIDEIHTITAAGESEGAMNAGNILKPALSRGEIRRHHLLGVPQVHREGSGPRAPVPAGAGGGAQHFGHHRRHERHQAVLRGLSPRPGAGGCGQRGGHPVGAVHHRPLPARQGHRPAGRGLRQLQPGPPRNFGLP